MTVKTNRYTNPSTLDLKAESAASQIANKHGLRDRARSTWYAMANELLEELQPVIEDQSRAEADQASKTRLRAVLELPEATGREDLARNMALDTDSSVEQIKSILASTPKQTHDPLAAAMQGKSPGISSDDGAPEFATEEDEVEAAAQSVLNA